MMSINYRNNLTIIVNISIFLLWIMKISRNIFGFNVELSITNRLLYKSGELAELVS